MFVYVVSFAFFAGGSVASLDGVLLDDSIGVQGDDMVVNGYSKWRCCIHFRARVKYVAFTQNQEVKFKM